MDKQQISLHDERSGANLPGDARGHHESEPPLPSFSAKAIQHGRHPANLGRMEHPDAHASCVGWCGEVMEIYLRLDGDRIAEAAFWADGCLSTMACGDMIAGMARGMTLEQARAITPQELIAALDGLPYKSHHCAELSVETLREALASQSRG